MNCQFCNQLCKRSGAKSLYHLCEPCKVFFHESKRETVFRPNSETHWYWLFIDLDENSTKVDVVRDPRTIPVEDQADMMGSEPKTILKLNSAMQGVTPQNMHDKLKTLLVFS
jgi:hypothetical protein